MSVVKLIWGYNWIKKKNKMKSFTKAIGRCHLFGEGRNRRPLKNIWWQCHQKVITCVDTTSDADTLGNMLSSGLVMKYNLLIFAQKKIYFIDIKIKLKASTTMSSVNVRSTTCIEYKNKKKFVFVLNINNLLNVFHIFASNTNRIGIIFRRWIQSTIF